jgi:hypothetical protein
MATAGFRAHGQRRVARSGHRARGVCVPAQRDDRSEGACGRSTACLSGRSFNGSTIGALFEEWNAVRPQPRRLYIERLRVGDGWFTKAGANARSTPLSSARSSETVISSRASLLVAEHSRRHEREAWTVITAPNSRELAESALRRSACGARYRAVSMLDTTKARSSALVDASRLIVTHALSIDNLR